MSRSAAAHAVRLGVHERIADAVLAATADLVDLSRRIHRTPEPAFEERLAAGWVAEAIARHGFGVEHPAGRLETAVRGVLRGGAGPGPRIAILAEYDALPGLGHGCGHNLMAASGVGAAVGLATVAADLPGEIVFLGTPAEERGSGKQVMLDDGLFAGVDAALLFHPSDRTHVKVQLLASEDIDVTFTGRPAHAASEPWAGLNALDALVLLFTSIGLWRQQLRPDARVHGIVLEGGTAANIIPDRAVGRFMIRSESQAAFAEMHARFQVLADAAASAAACSVEVVFSGATAAMRHNDVLAAVFAENLAAGGIVEGPMEIHLGSSDMGNVSQVLPTIHPCVAICPEGVPGHTVEFREAAVQPLAEQVMVTVATVVAQTAADLLLDPDLVAAAWGAFGSMDKG